MSLEYLGRFKADVENSAAGSRFIRRVSLPLVMSCGVMSFSFPVEPSPVRADASRCHESTELMRDWLFAESDRADRIGRRRLAESYRLAADGVSRLKNIGCLGFEAPPSSSQTAGSWSAQTPSACPVMDEPRTLAIHYRRNAESIWLAWCTAAIGQGHWNYRRLELSSSEIAREVRAWREQIQARSRGDASVGRRLAEHLLRPIKPLLSTHTGLHIDWPTQWVGLPWAALPGDSGEPLIMTHRLVDGRSASDRLAPGWLERPGLVVSPNGPDSSLRGAAHETQWLERRFASVTRLSGQLSEERIRTQARQIGWLHLALHTSRLADGSVALELDRGVGGASKRSGRFASDFAKAWARPRRSSKSEGGELACRAAVRLTEDTSGRRQECSEERRANTSSRTPPPGPDGYWSAREIREQSWPELEFVVLSGCRTAGEARGLARAFLAAGASRVLGSLWDVDDVVTPQWMARFYGYLEQTDSVSSAWIATQRDFASGSVSPHFQHPFFWAGFSFLERD